MNSLPNQLYGGPFWMVYQPERGFPTVKHLTQVEAETEATRLVEKHPGFEFFVLKTILSVTKPQPIIRKKF